jgi:hypothetical protein
LSKMAMLHFQLHQEKHIKLFGLYKAIIKPKKLKSYKSFRLTQIW